MEMEKTPKRLLIFSSEEREYILNSDFATTEVGLMLVERAAIKDGFFHAECSERDYTDFMRFTADELAYRGSDPRKPICAPWQHVFASPISFETQNPRTIADAGASNRTALLKVRV